MRAARFIGIVLALSALLRTGVLHAEVMDKEPTVAAVWAWSISGALLSFAFTRARWWLLLLALPLTTFKLVGPLLECHDQFIGPAIRSEAGIGYVVQVHAAFLLVLVGNAAGTFLSFRARTLPSPVAPAGTGA
jgi:hypothetical protein